MNVFNDVLPYPLEARARDKDGWGVSEEYLIPADERQKVLLEHYPFAEPPSLDDEVLDLHADKNFFVRDYKLVREDGHNLLVSPYYYESGGSVIDWVPLDAWHDDDDQEDELDEETKAMIEHDLKIFMAKDDVVDNVSMDDEHYIPF